MLKHFFLALAYGFLFAMSGAHSIGEAEEKSPGLSMASNWLSPEELAAGWLLLFDGETLFGWKAASQTDWQVVDGEIRSAGGEKGLLHTTTQFADFELMCDFKSEPHTNSGIFLRTSPP